MQAVVDPDVVARRVLALNTALQQLEGKLGPITADDYVRVDRVLLAAAVRSALTDLRAFGGLAGSWVGAAG